MFKRILKSKLFWIILVVVVIAAVWAGLRPKHKPAVVLPKSRLAQIIPGVSRVKDVERLLGREEYSEVTGEWAPYSGVRYPEQGIRTVYVHYDNKSDKVDGFQFDLEPGTLTGMDVKMIYEVDDVSPDTTVRHNRLISTYKLEEPLVLAVTYEGPTETTPVYSLTYLTTGALNKGLLSKLPGASTDINGEWFVEDPAGNYPVHIYQGDCSFSGTYGYRGGVLYGTVSGRQIDFTWKQSGNQRGGRAHFTLSDDGKTLSGTWEYDPKIFNSGLTGGGVWTFRRKEE